MFKAFSYKSRVIQRLKNVVIINPSIIWIVNGMKRISISGTEYNLRQGDAIFLDANTRITFENIPENGLFFSKQINFIKAPNSDLFKKNKSGLEFYKLRYTKLDNRLRMTLDLFHEADSILVNIKTRSIWLDGIYSLLSEHNYLNVLFQDQKIDFDEIVYDTLERMDSRNHNIEKVCSCLGISKATLIRRLRKSGTQFKKIVKQVRVNNALYIIQKGNYDLNDVSILCGYHSVKVFNSYFEEEFGLSPKSYISTIMEV